MNNLKSIKTIIQNTKEYQSAIKDMQEADCFICITEKGDKTKLSVRGMSVAEAVYLLELAKQDFLNDEKDAFK